MLKKIITYSLNRISKKIYPSDKLMIKNTRINDYNIIVIGNEDVGRSMLFYKYFEPRETCFMKKIIQPHFICLDIGANVGYYSLLFASLAYKGKVYSFEPVPLGYHLLMANIEINNFENIEAYNVALGEKNGRRSFSVASDSAFSSFKDVGRKKIKKVIDVDVVPLDEFVRENKIEKIDILKMDVEGAEKLVLNGAKNIFSNDNLLPKIMMLELYDKNFIKYQTSVSEMTQHIRDLGYRMFFVDNDLKLRSFTEENYNNVCNVICIAGSYDIKRLFK